MRISNSFHIPERELPTKPAAETEKPDLQLSEDDKKQVEKLKKRDTEVRAHERAHAAAGGHMAGAPNYQFETGPDGQRYAVSGDVPIKMPSAEDPATRAQEARQVRAAATAPSRPSSQDMKVAAEATKIEMEALAEMREEQNLKVCENCGSVHGLDRVTMEAAQGAKAAQ